MNKSIAILFLQRSKKYKGNKARNLSVLSMHKFKQD